MQLISFRFAIILMLVSSLHSAWFSSCGYHENAVLRLMSNFESRLFGQKMASIELVAQITSHISKENPTKPLVMSLHGHTGTGKTFTTRIIAESIFTERGLAKHVHREAGGRYSDPTNVEEYVKILESKFNAAVSKCPQSMIIIDEVHLMAPGLLDRLRHYFDYESVIDKVNYAAVIFIFISNLGATVLNSLAFQNMELTYSLVSNKLRENLMQYSKSQDVIKSGMAGIPFDLLVKESFVRYIPYFPLFPAAVHDCFTSQLSSYMHHIKTQRKIGAFAIESILPNSPVVAWLTSKLQFEMGISVTGCKQVGETISSAVEYVFTKTNIDAKYELAPHFPWNWIKVSRALFHNKKVRLDIPQVYNEDHVVILVADMGTINKPQSKEDQRVQTSKYENL